MTNDNLFPLDERTWRFIEARLTQMVKLEAELNGALGLVIDQNALEGKWRLDAPNRCIVRVDNFAKSAEAA